ncbi:hypothetical protein P691DRAFT_263369 [Macrolepiota fuliginosa MF-IS2]|uniref:Uncharacterized protein n=1 Tax=Macrolepiota fuliginosa MF-IS2 TaxID=1400762 RepID=A0A9P6BZL7_9AGAR|nr:hypothetical protein P691DRAFT_263369 [Macrolepiota fuliginosa MF-IS2]
MRRRAESTSEGQRPLHPSVQTAIYSHVTTYRSVQLELQLYSPSLKVEDGSRGPLAVFSHNDKVSGKVFLDPSCHHTGKLSVTLEGAFYYVKTNFAIDENTDTSYSRPVPHKHVFLTSTTHISVCPSNENSTLLSFQTSFMRRRPSASCLCRGPGSSKRSFPFSFELPRSFRTGEELPCTFSSLKDVEPISRPNAVIYKILAHWEPSMSLDNSSSLEVPIILQADADFQSIDASPRSLESWTEMPLKAERPVPFRCAVTLPSSITFSRSSVVPYFVVFTTNPRSPTLAKEIAADASISISFIRQIVVTEQASLPPTPPITPSHDELDSPTGRGKLLRKVARNVHQRQRSARSDLSTDPRDKPLPELPTQTFMETRTIRSDMCIGFQKRPRHQCDPGRHPSLDAQMSLPDGLYKAKIALNNDMLPCIDWCGISVKYYLDISVLIGQDELRARVPLQLI